MGIVNYYRKFVRSFAAMSNLLRKKLRKKAAEYLWDDDQQNAFESLLTAVTTALVLAPPDMGQEFILYTDASTESLGAELGQIGDYNQVRSIYFFSPALIASDKNYTTTKKELHAVMVAFKKFRLCVLERSTTVVTDDAAIKGILGKMDTSMRLARRISILSEYQYKIEYSERKCHKKCRHIVVHPIARAYE